MIGKRRMRLIAPIIVNIFVALRCSWACSGGAGKSSYKPVVTTTTTTEKAKKIPEGAWGGFQVPPEEQAKWDNWLAQYNAQQKLLDAFNQNGTAAIDDTDGPGSSWPHSWKGAGIGNKGFPPMEIPPWGYKTKNLGLPTYCYTPPEKGHCDRRDLRTSSIRWAYNPYIEDCQKFEYSGCRGNNNNFKSQLACMEVCNKPPPSGCAHEVDEPVEGDLFLDEGVPLEFQYMKRRCGHDVHL